MLLVYACVEYIATLQRGSLLWPFLNSSFICIYHLEHNQSNYKTRNVFRIYVLVSFPSKHKRTRLTTVVNWSPYRKVILCIYFFPWRWGGSSTQAWMPAYVSMVNIPQMIWVWRATVELYWQGKTEELGEKPVPVPLCPPQIPHGLTWARTRASAVRGRRLTTWAM
jgi:hypothetical protein